MYARCRQGTWAPASLAVEWWGGSLTGAAWWGAWWRVVASGGGPWLGGVAPGAPQVE
jgi:hypothetical protein